MNFDKFKTVAEEGKIELSRKGSRFIGICLPSSEEKFEGQLERLEKEYSDADHICFGSVLISKDRAKERYDNDGEPSGTAGEPILQVIKGKELYQTSVFVIRYFGGTELGTGGLVRAYGEAAKAALEDSRVIVRRRRVELELSYPYSFAGSVMAFLEASEEVEIKEIEYGERPVVKIGVPVDRAEKIENELIEVTSGKVRVKKLEGR